MARSTGLTRWDEGKMLRAISFSEGFDEVIFSQVLDEIDFATHVEWDVTGQWDDAGGQASLVFAAGMAGTLTQINADQAANALNSKEYVFKYEVTVNTAIAPADSVVLTLSGIPLTGQNLPIAAGTHYVYFQSAADADSQDFLITAVDDQNGGTTAGDIDIDNVSLTRCCDAGVNPDCDEWCGIGAVAAAATVSATSMVGDNLTSIIIPENSIYRGRYSRVLVTAGKVLVYRM